MLLSHFTVVVQKYKQYSQLFGIIILIFYSVIGGIIFTALEAPNEAQELKQELKIYSKKAENARNRLSSDLQVCNFFFNF